MRRLLAGASNAAGSAIVDACAKVSLTCTSETLGITVFDTLAQKLPVASIEDKEHELTVLAVRHAPSNRSFRSSNAS
jgi:hypothetical protein